MHSKMVELQPLFETGKLAVVANTGSLLEPSIKAAFDCSRQRMTSNGRGSDHGWGGHQSVLGAAVDGRRTYGRLP